MTASMVVLAEGVTPPPTDIVPTTTGAAASTDAAGFLMLLFAGVTAASLTYRRVRAAR